MTCTQGKLTATLACIEYSARNLHLVLLAGITTRCRTCRTPAYPSKHQVDIIDCSWLLLVSTYLACPGVQASKVFYMAGYGTMAILVGNSKLLWQHFLQACLKDAALLKSQDPVEEYIEHAISAIVSAAGYAPAY